ncbi:MAG: sensor histidine kinase [Helicobacteraceae bacterium]|nr:sensor histidine kinase [Helicobacteraceae bacterium]
MNKLEKKSFYSFLFLYVGSSLLFVLLSGYWYYSAQKSSLENITYYKLEHLADKVSALVINAHMRDIKLTLPDTDIGYEYFLIPSSKRKVFNKKYFEKDGFKILVSTATQEHLNIEYVVVKTDEFNKKVENLQVDVVMIMVLVFIIIVVISSILSKLFMRPIREKMSQIENFVQDISHELNTPITALTMSSKRAMQKKIYDEKILRNISISTKQLYTIYQSLAYMNFSSVDQETKVLDLQPILFRSIEYYEELTMAKNITIKTDIKESILNAVESQVELLFSNLISNAIKYSMPNTSIHIILKDGLFSISDEGIGIAKEKLEEIFKLYERNSSLAGGFGVGLNIVKKITKEYKIDVEVTSELGVGSCFTLKW